MKISRPDCHVLTLAASAAAADAAAARTVVPPRDAERARAASSVRILDERGIRLASTRRADTREPAMADWRTTTDGAGDLLGRSPSETAPLLLELACRQASRRRPADLTAQLARDAFVQPSALDQRTLHRLDGLALDAAPDFAAVALSPVAPLGTCSVLAPTAQDRTLATTRGTEVVSDPTNVLALLCAQRLARAPHDDVRLCTVHQVLRAQPLPPQPGFSRHFRLLAMAEAGRARADDGFEVDAIARHVAAHDRLFDAAAALGCTAPARKATIYVAARRSVLAGRVRERLAAVVPHVALIEEPFESPYYDGLRVLFGAQAASGDHVPLADVGLFDWVARLASNRKLRLCASGFGLQLLPLLFRRA